MQFILNHLHLFQLYITTTKAKNALMKLQNQRMQPVNYLGLVFLVGIIPSLIVLWIVPDLIPLHHDVAGMVNDAGFFIREPHIASEYGIPIIPMEHWFYGFPVYLSAWAGIPAKNVIVLQIFLIAQFSSALACWIIYIGGLTNSKTQTVLWVLGVYAIIFAIPLTYTFRNIFGLREHLFVATILPYLMLLCARLSGYRPNSYLTAIVGLLAGTGIIIKPLYAVLFVIVEFVFFICSRRFLACIRLDSIIIVLIGTCYLLFWVICTDYFIQLKYLVSTIQGYLNPQGVVLLIGFYYLTPALILLIHVLFRRKDISEKDKSVFHRAAIFFSACLAVVLVLYLQQRGFSHHRFPISAFTIFLTIAIWHVLPKWLLFIALMLSIGIIWKDIDLESQMIGNKASQSIGSTIRGKTVSVISPHLRPFHTAILNLEGNWRFPIRNMAYLAAEYKQFDTLGQKVKYIPIKNMSEGSLYFHEKVIGMLEHYPPDFIIVDTTYPRWPMKYIHVDYLKALKMDERFEAIWKNYKLIQSSRIQGFHISYDMYAYQKTNDYRISSAVQKP